MPFTIRGKPPAPIPDNPVPIFPREAYELRSDADLCGSFRDLVGTGFWLDSDTFIKEFTRENRDGPRWGEFSEKQRELALSIIEDFWYWVQDRPGRSRFWSRL